jgi:hypothetical protein
VVWLAMGEHGLRTRSLDQTGQRSPAETLPGGRHGQQTVHLWRRSERITLSAAVCGFFCRRRVKVFVNTTARGNITLHLCTAACRTFACQFVRRDRACVISLELAAPSAAPGHRWESLRRKYGQLAHLCSILLFEIRNFRPRPQSVVASPAL